MRLLIFLTLEYYKYLKNRYLANIFFRNSFINNGLLTQPIRGYSDIDTDEVREFNPPRTKIKKLLKNKVKVKLNSFNKYRDIKLLKI